MNQIGTRTRPPIENTPLDGERTINQHVFPFGVGWYYPCKGCAVEKGTAAMDRPCPHPYTSPEAVGHKLDRIITLLETIARNYTKRGQDMKDLRSDKREDWSPDQEPAWRVWQATELTPTRVTIDQCFCIAPGGKPFCYVCGYDEGRDHTPTCKHTKRSAAYRAEVTDSEGTRILAAFTASTKEHLLHDIQASGLVTSVQHALWLGAEVGKL